MLRAVSGGCVVFERVRTSGLADFWGEQRDDHRRAGNKGRGLCRWGIVNS